MSRRRSAKILIPLGVLLLLAGAVMRFYVVPSVSKLPNDLDVTNHYAGTGTLLNAAALQAGDTANAVASNVPVTVDRHTYVSGVEGDTAIVHDDFTVNAPGGISLPTNHIYALDRKSMEAAQAPAGTDVEPHQGLTIGLPISPDSGTAYQLYDFATGSTVPMKYTGAATVSGRSTLGYAITASGALRDKAILSALPAALPKAQLAGLAPLLPSDVQAKIGAAAATLPDPVPLKYTAASDLALAVDETLGTPVDGTMAMKVVVNVDIAGEQVAIMPVMALDTKLTSASIAAAADTAASTSRLLFIGSIVVPVTLVILGLILIGLGVVRLRPSVSSTADSADRRSTTSAAAN
ncbi:porin PorA family protein [Nocardia aurea]|uniref:porin PorA family protein n=1 Tax=Nocardia aurea TaxID=2144174 RepID=UPI000D689307|nr:porin PorA family protein [Nocardia aurea]